MPNVGEEKRSREGLPYIDVSVIASRGQPIPPCLHICIVAWQCCVITQGDIFAIGRPGNGRHSPFALQLAFEEIKSCEIVSIVASPHLQAATSGPGGILSIR